jgi:endonuclease G
MRLSLLISILSFWGAEAHAVTCPEISDEQKGELISFHLYGGPLSPGKLYIRRGYVLSYNETYRVPSWAAWRAQPGFRNTPLRKGKWSTFRKDTDVPDGVVKTEYNGLYYSPDNFARGHIVPYFISGGDRDNDGQDADVGTGIENAEINDIDDACTVFEINYMSNIAPQYHERFNGQRSDGRAGLWYQLETLVRQMVDNGRSFHIIAGTIFGDAEVQLVGSSSDNKPDNIGVPHMFFKVLIGQDGVVPFLFVHQARVSPYGCEMEAELKECIVTLEELETASGYDFFSVLSGEPSQTWSQWGN